MAFTEDQKNQIRIYLGFPAGWYFLDVRLEGMMDKVGQSAIEQASVETIMASIAALDVAISNQSASGFTLGSLKRADDVELYDYVASGGAATIVPPKMRGNWLINRLAARFGYRRDELLSDYFGAAGGIGAGEMALG